jgi:hypothetical protein
MNWEVLVGGTATSLIAVFLVEVVLRPIVHRWQMRGTTGTYLIHSIDGTPIRNAAGKSNYAKLMTKGWFKPRIVIEAFDYDTKQAWEATANFDELGFHGYGFYRYGNQEDAGAIELHALSDGKWACRTYAYHTNVYSVLHWYKQ